MSTKTKATTTIDIDGTEYDLTLELTKKTPTIEIKEIDDDVVSNGIPVSDDSDSPPPLSPSSDSDGKQRKLRKIGEESDKDGRKVYIYEKQQLTDGKDGPVMKTIQLKRAYMKSSDKEGRQRVAEDCIRRIVTEGKHFKNAEQRYAYYMNYCKEVGNRVKPYALRSFDRAYHEQKNLVQKINELSRKS